MRIKSTLSDNQVNNNNGKASFKGFNPRSAIRTLSNPNSLSTTVLLEGGVTSGRGFNAYKRGGKAEFRERLTDDLLAAVFWMKGVDIFNKINDKIGKRIFKMPETEFDVGKDALRTPFENVVESLGKGATEAEQSALRKKLATYKFSKVLLSTAMAVGFVGFILPKINQAITSKMMGKNKEKTQNSKSEIPYNVLNQNSIETFEKAVDERSSQPSFKGIEKIATTGAYLLENNTLCKMMSSDVGIMSGRMLTARNKDEALEYGFRDASSAFFYYASTPLIYKVFQKLTGSTKATSIDPVASKQINEVLLKEVKGAEGAKMGVEEFSKKTLGLLDDAAKGLMEKIPFKSDVVSLEELSKHLGSKELIEKAAEMAKLQPKQAGVGAVLTRQQVADVLKNGSLNTPEFMNKIFGEKFGAALTDPKKYISMKKITGFRDNIDDYVKGVIETATKKNGGVVDEKLLNSINKKSFVMSAGFRLTATLISALCLGILIPKVQYAITKKRTGSAGAPGLRQYETNSATENKPAEKSSEKEEKKA